MKNIFLILVLSFCVSQGSENKNSYVSLKENTAWSYKMNDQMTIIQIKGKEKIEGKPCNKLEWRLGNPNNPAIRAEFWYAKGDSIFCRGIQVFGTTAAYPAPMLVLAETTKPGDSWKVVVGKAPFIDTVTFRAESYDSVYEGGQNIGALKITRNSKGLVVLTRWFAKGRGIVKEETPESSTPSSSVLTLQPTNQSDASAKFIGQLNGAGKDTMKNGQKAK
jgi:hypothetical protein